MMMIMIMIVALLQRLRETVSGLSQPAVMMMMDTKMMMIESPFQGLKETVDRMKASRSQPGGFKTSMAMDLGSDYKKMRKVRTHTWMSLLIACICERVLGCVSSLVFVKVLLDASLRVCIFTQMKGM